ncbi:MAG: hypothetical protein IPM33_09970 [Phycisphaerales bacterium]|nr:hypothetical protein [Phycisphaerales bacterium]
MTDLDVLSIRQSNEIRSGSRWHGEDAAGFGVVGLDAAACVYIARIMNRMYTKSSVVVFTSLVVGCTTQSSRDSQALSDSGLASANNSVHIRQDFYDQRVAAHRFVMADKRFIAAQEKASKCATDAALRLIFTDPSALVVADAAIAAAKKDFDEAFRLGNAIAQEGGYSQPFTTAYTEEYLSQLRRGIASAILERRAKEGWTVPRNQ